MARAVSVPWKGGDAVVTFSDRVTADDEDRLKRRFKELGLLYREEQERAAKYKVEVLFGASRSVHRPFTGVVTLWEGGSVLNGDGDAKVYICPGKDLLQNGCEALILQKHHGDTAVVCSSCGVSWKSEQLFGEVFYRLPLAKWADVLFSWFSRMNFDADLRLKYARDDIRVAAMKEQERQRGGELLTRVRSSDRRSSAVYPLHRIIQDTAAGRSISDCILAFLKA